MPSLAPGRHRSVTKQMGSFGRKTQQGERRTTRPPWHGEVALGALLVGRPVGRPASGRRAAALGGRQRAGQRRAAPGQVSGITDKSTGIQP